MAYKISPLSRVGIYIPGGTASYPSSVIMNAVPAIVAGVKNITLCMPTPNNKINAGVVYAAKICGVKKISGEWHLRTPELKEKREPV